MTVITGSFQAPSQSGNIGASGTLWWQPTARYTGASSIVLPQPFIVQVDSNGSMTPINVDPTGATWVYKVTESFPGISVGTIRYVQVPSSGPIAYKDLVDVDPLSLAPNAQVPSVVDGGSASSAARFIRFRRDTAANWTAANPVLGAGEPGLETDTGNSKLGDGVTAWNGLGYQAPNAAVLNANYARTVTLSTGVSAASPNTALIQAALNNSGTIRIQCPSSDTAFINNTLVVGSSTTVFVECTLQLVIGSTALPLWQNAAHGATPQSVTSFTQTAWSASAVPPGIYGTVTVASHTLNPGDWVAVEGSTTSGYNGVFQVLSTTSTTLTVLMPFTAAATTAAGTPTFAKADTDITINGGAAFQNGANQTFNSTDNLNCGSIWHRVNNLTIQGMRVIDSKRYAWHIACANRPVLRNVHVENVGTSGASDGIHFGGAVFNLLVDGVTGKTGDDFVSLTIGDYSVIQMSKGDFYNSRIKNLAPTSVKGEIVKMTGGSGQFYFKDTVIDGVGGVGAIYAVQVYDDPSSGGTLLGTAGDRLVIKNVAASCQQVLYCNITGAFDEIEIDGVDANLIQNSAEIATVNGSSTVKKITISHATKTKTSSFLPQIVTIGGTANVDRADIQDCYIVSGGISGQYFYAIKQASGATLTRASIARSSFQSGGSSGGSIFASSAGAVDGVTVTLRDVYANQLDSMSDFSSNGTLAVGPGVIGTNLWGSSRVTSKASGKKVTLVGGPILPIRNKADLVVSGGGLSDVYSDDFYMDGVQVTTPAAGSRFYNTNTAWSSGSGTDKSGLYAYTGAAWVKIYGPA